ncbi:class I SAM-dependent methyltransferase [Nitrospina gracilis]|uniref:class I SAM-dependent methyltransferase n=1 Tax=Nitrospina gracilis TaxID=35801 RepID=UPI001F26D552|nr:class I SAM-dependent methyltransferase [Nitrospina gracilis]MCF8719389.1 ubiquinone/menaquinone biosynthesis C-methylase UbiE [Nitrospina gracilis Nb-211]
MDRKEYWNKNYLEYWKQRVEEADADQAESRVVPKDPVTGSDKVIRDLLARHAFRPGNVLEVGCAWGRWFGFYREHGLEVHGVDISRAMIEAAQQDWQGKDGIGSIREAEAEALPFDDNSFDNVTCLAVFDATFQHRALAEMVRVAKPGALIVVTGKSDRYFEDDSAALDAEAGARRKQHPNFFTDVPAMLEQIAAQSHTLLSAYYFPRRGDFGQGRFATETEQPFYEYMLFLEKGGHRFAFTPFSSDHSRTFSTVRGFR